MIQYQGQRTEGRISVDQYRTIIVAKDGSGDYTSLQAAVDAIPEEEEGGDDGTD